MDKNLRFGRVAMLNATRLEADIRIDEELESLLGIFQVEGELGYSS